MVVTKVGGFFERDLGWLLLVVLVLVLLLVLWMRWLEQLLLAVEVASSGAFRVEETARRRRDGRGEELRRGNGRRA